MDRNLVIIFGVVFLCVLAYVLIFPSNSPVKEAEISTTAQPLQKTAVFVTEKGTIKILLFTEDLPVTTLNFIDLVDRGFYDNLTFHRVETGFVIQTGDPTATGRGGSGKTIPLETSPKHKNVRGGVGMARTSDPNSASSQFYILMRNSPALDGGYSIFGEVTQGMDVVEQIQVGDRIVKASIE